MPLRMKILRWVSVCFIGVLTLPIKTVGTAFAQETSTALRALDIAPITNVDRLVQLGCTDAMKITKRISPSTEKKTAEGRFRVYNYEGMELVTIADQVEVVWGARIDKPFVPRWGLLPSNSLTLSGWLRKFGKSSQMIEGAQAYMSEQDERAVVLVRFSGPDLTVINWSCG